MLIALLAVSALTASDPDVVMTTAPTGAQSVAADAVAPVGAEVPTASSQAITPQELTTAEQIDRWINQRTAGAKSFADDDRDALWPRDDRKVHGEVSAAIGTGDFTAYSATVSIPVGESGRLDLSYSQSKNDPYAYGYGPYGFGYPGQGVYGLSGRGSWDTFHAGPGSARSFGLSYSSDSDRKDCGRDRDRDRSRTFSRSLSAACGED